MLTGSLQLPPHFRFGVATAAYQIEGAVAEDGRGVSIWDTFSRTPGKVLDGATGDVACDHYHRHAEDVTLLRDLGVHDYRFSIAWPRIQPDGTGAANPAGLAFYDRLVDDLLAAGVTPAITLYHWDLPQALEDEGGWTARDTAHRFADYAALVGETLGDRAGSWFTLNEPACAGFLGYATGLHAPGRRLGTGALAAAHHLLLGHGLAVDALRSTGTAPVGIVLNPTHAVPATDAEHDLAAVRRVETQSNLVWSDPLFAGRYPEHEAETWGAMADGSYRRDGDLDVIGAPLDLLGVNFYAPTLVADAAPSEPHPELRHAADVGWAGLRWQGARYTRIGWPVVPETVGDLLRGLRDRYPGLPPVVITENGCAEDDVVAADGGVHDPRRIEYLQGHLAAVAGAIADGVDVRGYYVWSLMDNFEWARGYRERFGLVHVDYATQVRTPKDSFGWYRDLIAAHREARHAA